MNRLWGVAAASIIFFSACSSPLDTSPHPQAVSVSLKVELPRQVGGLQSGRLSAPATASSAVVNIYDGTTPAGTANFSSTSTTQSIELLEGKTYRFDTSVQNAAGLEVAWGTVNYAVTSGLTARMAFSTIVAAAKLVPASFVGDSAQVALQLSTPDASVQDVPLSDYMVDYAATGGTVQEGSKLGAVIVASGFGNVGVIATVKAMTKDHTVGTFMAPTTLTYTLPVLPGATFGGTLPNWLTGSSLTATLSANTSGLNTLSGQVDTNGRFTVQLPDGEHKSTFADLTSAFSNAQYSVPSDQLMGITLVRPFFQISGVNIGNLYLKNNGNSPFSYLVFVNTDVNVTGIYNDPYRISSFHYFMNLKKGWNVISFYYSNPSYDLRPYYSLYATRLEELPADAVWMAGYTAVNDLSVALSADRTTVPIGDKVNYTVSLQVNGMSLASSAVPVKVAVSRGLSFVNDPNNTCQLRATDPPVTGQPVAYYCQTALTSSGQGTLTFQTSADPLTSVPGNPAAVTAQVDPSMYLNLNTANALASVSISRNDKKDAVVINPSLGTVKVTGGSFPQTAAVGLKTPLIISADADNTLSKYEIYDGVRLIGSGASAPARHDTFSYDWTPRQAGTTTLTVVVYDTAGTTGLFRTNVAVQ